MTDPEIPADLEVFGLLSACLGSSSRRDGPLSPAAVASWPLLPTAGTLPGFARRLGGGWVARQLNEVGRSLAQVIFINNPLSGGLLVLALLLQGAAMASLCLLGIVAANFTAHAIGADGRARRQGIHGFNGALLKP